MRTSETFSVNKGFAAILILLLGLAIAAAGSIAYSQLKPSPSPQPFLAGSPTPTDETVNTEESQSVYTDEGSANWKTYRNEKFQYELKYPLTWYVQRNDQDTPNLLILRPTKGSSSSILFAPTGDIGRESIFDGRVDSKTSTKFSDKEASEIPRECSKTREMISYASGICVRAIHVEDLQGTLWGENNEIFYDVREPDFGLLPIFDQILSTVKFLD